MYDENQTFVPESFTALYQDSRRRLTISKDELAQRSEFCEDLASLVSAQLSNVHVSDRVDTETILERTLAGLRSADAGVSEPEAVWVTHRAAELLQWEWPSRLDLPPPSSPPP